MTDTPTEGFPLPEPEDSPSRKAEVPRQSAPLVVFKEGAQVGDYLLVERLLDEPATETWLALQKSVKREVALEWLKPEFAANAAALKGFRALVRARAAVVHQYIAPVYEIQETGGAVYYTRESVQGRDLGQMHGQGVRLGPDQVMSILLATSEAMAHLDEHGISRVELTPDAVHLGHDGIPRLDNLAVANPSHPPAARAEMKKFGRALSMLLHRGKAESAAVDDFLRSLMAGSANNWRQAAEKAREFLRMAAAVGAEAGSKPATATAFSARPRPGSARRRARKSVPPLVLVGTLLVCTAIIAGAYLALTGAIPAVSTREYEKMVPVPAGNIVGPNGVEAVEPFFVSVYEVTIGQYAAFLAALESTGAAGKYDHPDQPASKGDHVPNGWKELFRTARNGGRFQGQQISLRHPIFAIDWWDAYAYAQWKGDRLPTAAEWHLAALGDAPEARFPWGKRDAPTFYNSGADFHKDAAGGEVDGFHFWAPVDAFPNDRSPCGAVGMAGNVSEWVGSWVHHPDFPDIRVPVIMGGSFAISDPVVTERRPAKNAGATQLAVGFRTARSAP